MRKPTLKRYLSLLPHHTIGIGHHIPGGVVTIDATPRKGIGPPIRLPIEPGEDGMVGFRR
ncbi:hypothetical protein GCM10009670_10010 [Citricoccus alkalitolerans]